MSSAPNVEIWFLKNNIQGHCHSQRSNKQYKQHTEGHNWSLCEGVASEMIAWMIGL